MSDDTSPAPEPVELAALISDAGLEGLPERVRSGLARELYTELEQRVGNALTEAMPVEWLDEFEQIAATGDDSACAQWLQRRCPHHRDVVRTQLDLLRSELIAHAARIRGAAARGVLT